MRLSASRAFLPALHPLAAIAVLAAFYIPFSVARHAVAFSVSPSNLEAASLWRRVSRRCMRSGSGTRLHRLETPIRLSDGA